MTSPLALLAYVTLAAALLLGGGARRDVPSDYIVELISLPLLAAALPGAISRLRADPVALAFILGLLTLVLIHLIPLPPSLWGALPGRDIAIASFTAADLDRPFLPLSMQPQEALKGALALIPAIALFLAVINLTSSARWLLVVIALTIGIISLPLGILQLLSGKGSPLYFYAITNPDRAVGFFANANHYAALFYVLIPLSAAVFAEQKTIQGIPYWSVMIGLTIACIMGLAVSGSRSALVLGVLSLALSGYYLMRAPLEPLMLRRSNVLVTILAAALVILLASAMGLSVILGRFEGGGSVDEARYGLFAATWDLIWRYFPVGSGLGAFERIYEIYGPGSPGGGAVANHAHNDYLELAMETGLGAMILVALFFVWLVGKARGAFALEDSFDSRLGIAAIFVIVLLGLHSAWDYPLRTIALSSLFGMACAFLFAAPVSVVEESPQPRRRRRSTQHTPAADAAVERRPAP